jgi:hypothetical protein
LMRVINSCGFTPNRPPQVRCEVFSSATPARCHARRGGSNDELEAKKGFAWK